MRARASILFTGAFVLIGVAIGITIAVGFIGFECEECREAADDAES